MSGSPSRVAVLGPGAVGGLLAAVFCRNDVDVTCVGSATSTARILQRGITLRSTVFGDIQAYPPATDRLETFVDILFVTVKQAGLSDALDRITPARLHDALIVPLLNGVGHLEPMRAALGPAVVAGSIGEVEAYRNEAGEVVHASGSVRVAISSDLPPVAARLVAVKDLLEECGIASEVSATEADTTWGKLVRLCPLAATTAAAQLSIGEIRRSADWRSRLRHSVDETVQVARAEGAQASPSAVMASIDALPAGLLTSLARDVAEGRRGEADAIIGGVINSGVRHGLECPTLTELTQRIDAHLTAERRVARPSPRP
jgi:2-dehydropantoate 2-reductase